MKFFITLTKKNIAILIAVIILATIFTGDFLSAKSTEIDGSTNALRVNYIKSLGYAVDEIKVTSKDIVIPEKFNDVYKNYNALQKKAGFDLSEHKGKTATVYSFPLSGNTATNINIIVMKGKIIGGDIAETKFSGEMKPLLKS